MSDIHGAHGHHEGHEGAVGEKRGSKEKSKPSMEQLQAYIDGIDTTSGPDAENFKREMQAVLKAKGDEAFEHMQKIVNKYMKKSGGDNSYEPTRLEMDFANETSNYSRINFLEVMVAFNYNRNYAVKHLRMSKVMDGITLCSKEFGICEGLSAGGIEEKIYNVIRNGKSGEKNIKVNVENPEDGKVEVKEVSLNDFGQFMDIYEFNKSLGAERLSYKTLIFNFFSGSELKAGGVDLKSQIVSDNLNDIDIADYLKTIKKHRVGFETLEEFRYASENHRENAGHAFKVIMADGSSVTIPVSGRMAAEITAADMRKGSKGAGGHPHEVGDLSEETGTMVRYRYRDLRTNRRELTDANKHSQTNSRFARMAMGLDSEGVGMEVGETEGKKIIYLGGKMGKDGEKPSGMVAGMHAHHDKIRKLAHLDALTDKQAADLFMTDVIAPIFLNNEDDWLMCLASVYNVGGTKSSITKKSILTKKKPTDLWEDFELKIVCKDFDKPGNPVGEVTFTGFKQLKDYIMKRFNNGEIDQKIDITVSKDQVVNDKHKTKETLNAAEIEAAKSLLSVVLGSESSVVIDKYIKCDDPKTLEVTTKIGAKDVVSRRLSLNQLLLEEIENLRNSDPFVLTVNLDKFLGEGIDSDDEEDIISAINSFVDSLLALSKEDRKKFK